MLKHFDSECQAISGERNGEKTKDCILTSNKENRYLEICGKICERMQDTSNHSRLVFRAILDIATKDICMRVTFLLLSCMCMCMCKALCMCIRKAPSMHGTAPAISPL